MLERHSETLNFPGIQAILALSVIDYKAENLLDLENIKLIFQISSQPEIDYNLRTEKALQIFLLSSPKYYTLFSRINDELFNNYLLALDVYHFINTHFYLFLEKFWDLH